jgi:AcrR family transcriptional regulator
MLRATAYSDHPLRENQAGPAVMTHRVARSAEQRGSARGRKSTQRERLLGSVIAVVDREGYAGTSVSRIIAEAGVSRPTFYEYFRDKESCFLEAVTNVHARLMERVRQRVSASPPQLAIHASLEAIVELASTEHDQALFLTSQAMGAGPRALDTRDAGIGEIERVIVEAHSRVPPGVATPDVSPQIVIGGIYRLLASRLRRGEPGLSRAIEDLSAWVESYGRSAGARRWQSFESLPSSPKALASLSAPLPAPSALAARGPGVSREQAAANQRHRILYAAAQLAEHKGYNATTIADITRLAGVDGRTFYAAFADKQDAFMAVHELGVQHVMSATAGAFFTGSSWPERMWAAGEAFAGFIESNPMIAHVGFVEAYAVGPGAVQRVEDSHVTFTIFLQEGYQHKPTRASPSRLALEAVITSIFEIVYRQARSRREPRVSGMLGSMAFLALAPFLGAEEANRFIERQLQT